VKKLIKLLKKLMQGYDIDALIAIKDSFQGQNFQWIKTQDRSKIGQVVRVNDVTPGNRGMYIAHLSDGSKVPTDRLTSDLMMLMDDQPALSISEVMSINMVPSLSESTGAIADTIPAEFRDELAAPIRPALRPTTVEAPRERSADPGDLFGMFSLEQTDLSLSVSIKLPARNLLKMMYSNSQNKEEFLDRLAAYINNNVTAQSIKDSMRRTLDPDKKKKPDATSA
jgi:hypothetical protein